MPIARKIDKDIPKDFLNQMKTNLKKTPVVVEEEPPVQASVLRQAQEPQSSVVPEALEGPQHVEMPTSRGPSTGSGTTVAQPPKAFETAATNAIPVKTDKYADVMNIRLSKGRRNEIKAFCSSNGVTVTQYIESSFEFLSREVAAGNISLSKGGITKKHI